MTTTTQRVKRPEIVLATWPNRAAGAELFGDKRSMYPVDGCDSMWLSLRVVGDDSYSAHLAKGTLCNIGLWVWWATDRDSVQVEFRAHDVYSATTTELERIISELRRLAKRVPARLHGQSYADYVLATLQAAGIKRTVEYRGIGVPEVHSPLYSIANALRDEIGARCPAQKAAA